MKSDPAWQAARLLPGRTPAERGARGAAFRAVERAYGFTNDAAQSFASSLRKSWVREHLPAQETQNRGVRAFDAVKQCHVGRKGKPRFKPVSRGLRSLSAKDGNGPPASSHRIDRSHAVRSPITDNARVDTRRLQLLLALSRMGSMRAVAEAYHLTTSTVSQQIAALAKESGVPLIEPEGRRVRLTPAGRRLADHAVTILAAVDAARLDLDPDAEPAGTLRVGGFATGVRVSLLPILADLAQRHPGVDVVISEYEPIEAFALLTEDDLDLALTYDYNLAPAAPGPLLETVPLWSIPWGLGVPAHEPDRPPDVSAYSTHSWIVNSRNTADEDAVRTLGALAGFAPRIAHQIDSLELVEDLIVAEYGVGLLPVGRPTGSGVKVVPLSDPAVVLTAYAVTRTGRATWPPLRAVLDRLRPPPGPLPWPSWPRPAAGE